LGKSEDMFASPSAIPWYRLALQTPLTTLAIFVVGPLILKETYPFSHFPMFSSPTAPRAYYMVTDSAGQPLPIAKLTGVTPPKIGKMHWRKSRASERGVDRAARQGADRNDKVGREICAMLRDQAARRGQALPPGMQLFRVEIRYHDGKLTETKELLFAE
jgi:hypothetical protein